MDTIKKHKGVLIASGVTAATLGYLLCKRYFQKGCKKPECSNLNKEKQGSVPSTPHLDQVSASMRAQELISSSVNYNLSLHLRKGSSYSGRVKIYFKTKCTSSVFVDFEGTKIVNVKVNGKIVEDLKTIVIGNFILIEASRLESEGNNVVEIDFENEYRRDGSGLHSFIDTDKKQYLYSQGEPYHIHKLFPCFDQPDIKGNLTLDVIAPDDWIVISNEGVKACNNLFGEKHWEFNTTPKISSYLYAVIAGPYEEIKIEKTYKGIPMSFFCRGTKLDDLLKIVDYFYEATWKSMEWYENFFKYPFPFSKYDQIFCPEFNVGAMEHPGAVTFADTYIFEKGVYLTDVMARECGTFAHELAHMWFGNLVTMKWWNDLWLNESFADFIAYFCLDKVNFSLPNSNFKKIFNVRKQWGYSTDQLSSTHPIALEVENTEAALSIFDGITYAKGASTILQLIYLMTEENFSNSVAKYFKKFEWSNTVLSDFMNEMKEGFAKLNYPFTLDEWRHDWIETSGTNTLTSDFDYNSTGNSLLKIKQGFCLPQHSTLRYHKILVAFFDKDGNIKTFPVLVHNKAVTEVTIDLEGKKYEAIYLNYGDQTFAQVILDDPSVEFFKKNITSLQSKLDKCMIWRDLYNMVKDAKVPASQYIETVANALEAEKDNSVLNDFLTNAYMAIRYFTPSPYKEELAMKIYPVLKKMVLEMENEAKNERFLLLVSNMITFAYSDASLEELIEILNGGSMQFIQLSVAQKWEIAKKVCMNKGIIKAEKEQTINLVSGMDSTDNCKLMVAELKARISDDKGRDEIWEMLKDPNCTESLFMQVALLRGFNHGDNPNYKYYDDFFEDFPHILKNKSQDFVKKFEAFGFPSSSKPEVMRKLILKCNSLLPKLDKNAAFGRKTLISNKETLEKRLLAFACYEKSLK